MLLSLAAGARSQEIRPAVEVTQTLAGEGFELVRAAFRHDTLYIAMENRVWRSQARGAAEAIRAAVPLCGDASHIALTLLHDGIPVTTVTVPCRQVQALLAGEITAGDFTRSVIAGYDNRGYRTVLAGRTPARPSYRKADVTVGPSLRMQFGNFDHPLEAGISVVPTVRVTLLKGMSLTGQLVVPLFSNIIGDAEGTTVRPGLLVLSQTFRLPYNLFTTVSAGSFSRNRYGIDGEARKFLFGGRVSAGVRLGYTGHQQFIDGAFYYRSPDRFTWFADGSWRWARYDLTLDAGYGSFIAGDRGWRAGVSRQFGEITIGFFALRTDRVWNGGFSFVVPLPPRHYGTRGVVRLRPVSTVPWEYRARGLPSQGREYGTGSLFDDWMPGMEPRWIRGEMGKGMEPE
ncbi:MAG TPA: YjbH domain-containing protein [Bacteroidales bacterium]|nr:YjbH domain-containing protein [Bacteroidales bacterium]